MKTWIEKLRQNNLLREINECVDIDQEIAAISYVEVKKANSKALLFNKPTDKNGKIYPPVLTNVFGSFEALNLILGRDANEIAAEISKLTKPKKPENFKEKFDFFCYLAGLRNLFPKKLKGRGECQSVIMDVPNLFELPILKTWKKDGGAFITMGQVYTKDPHGQTQNLGMYRLQVYDKNHLGVHWQIHKDAMSYFCEYAKEGKKMPVTVAIGGDPLYIWCAQAPMPKGVFELLLYGFIRKNPAKLVKSTTNDIFIPHDCDYVIEGFVDTAKELKDEGPFGDHTGFYTPILPFPVMEVTAITHKKDPVFNATVVGKPPLEDKFMGYATERIFLPLFQINAPDLIDYNMPENGVFHNLILAKIATPYPAAAKQMMHTFWGVGQMSFVKHAIFVNQDAPKLDEWDKFSGYVLDMFGTRSVVISEGVCDQLDHASPNSCFGGKLGIDCTQDFSSPAPEILGDNELFELFRGVEPKIRALKQYMVDKKSPIVVVNFYKDNFVKHAFRKLLNFKEYFKIVVFVDSDVNINNPYMLVWRVTNNIDAQRDISIIGEQICIDATAKHEWEGYDREWPSETYCDQDVIMGLLGKELIKESGEFFEKFEIIKL